MNREGHLNMPRRLLLRLLGGVSATSLGGAAFAQATSLQDLGVLGAPPTGATIFVAREIITMDPVRPRAEAVAVVDGRIFAVGGLVELQALMSDRPFKVDRTFADKVIMAGFVEQHVHPVLASLTMPSVVISIEPWDTMRGFSDQVRDDTGYRARLIEALAAHTDKSQVFVTWGYHHYFHGPMSRAILDELAPDFPVIVWHRSCHEFYLNTKVMEQYGVDEAFLSGFSPSEAAQSDLEKGHFYEQGAIKLLERITPAVATPERLRQGLEFTVDYYHRNGITTCCEPGGFYSKPLQQAINAVYSGAATPFNHYFIGDGKTFAGAKRDDPAGMIAMAEDVTTWGEGRTRYLPRQIKFLLDGAIYSQLMMMKDGYTDGHQGAWIMDPEVFNYAFQTFWDAGYHIHVHNNGDGGMDVLLDNLEQAQRRKPRQDHRMTIVHFGFAQKTQVDRAGRLGAIVSANPYYVTALAGRYKDFGIGPERSARMVPLADAKAAGMSMSFHSDMPMAPAKPLQLMWSAINRFTAEGDVAGPDQRVDLDTALKAITIDAAYSIRLEDEIGSITPGKFANFTILETSPYDVKPEDLAGIEIWGTVLEGRVQPAPPPPNSAGLQPQRASITASSRGSASRASSPLRTAEFTPNDQRDHDHGADGSCDACGALRYRLSSLLVAGLQDRTL